MPVLDGDTVDTLAARVFEIECDAYPEAIRLFAAKRPAIDNRKGSDPMTDPGGSEFEKSIAQLATKKVRFYVGGGDRGYVQGPVKKVEGDLIYIEKEGEIRGTMHTISIRTTAVRFYEFDTLVK